jgi:hypothetical protein
MSTVMKAYSGSSHDSTTVGSVLIGGNLTGYIVGVIGGGPATGWWLLGR